MKLFVYSVYDRKALVYGVPFFAHSDAVAARLYMSLLDDTSSFPSRFPDDFALRCIGSFDDQTGDLENLVSVVDLTYLCSRRNSDAIVSD